MEKKLLAFVITASLILAAQFAFAGNPGDSCSYYSSQDTQCNPQTGVYCVSYTCQNVSDTSIYCNDADQNNLAVSGDANSRYRDYDGAWRLLSNPDECLNNNQFQSSCSGSLCNVREATCTGTARVFETHHCESCQNGACLSYQPPSIIGQPCNYQSNGDSQCDVPNGIYCTGNTCQEPGDTNIYCNDTDGNNLSAKGTVSGRTRSQTGEFYSTTFSDSCSIVGSPASVCSWPVCSISEATCSGLLATFALHVCESCIDGACVSLGQQGTLGKVCDFAANGDNQCAPDQNIFCMGNKCTAANPPKISCIGQEEANVFNKTIVEFVSRSTIDGNLVIEPFTDNCLDENRLVEFRCTFDPNFTFYDEQEVDCAHGCFGGACLQAQGDNPSSVTDEELLLYITQWANREIDDEKMLYMVNVWKLNE